MQSINLGNNKLTLLDNIKLKIKNKYKTNTFLKFLAFSIIIISYLRSFWISDDSLITARIIINSLNGYGPVFNIGDNVQAFTHPLWFLINNLLTFYSGNVILSYFLVSIISIILSIIFIIYDLKSSISIALLPFLWCLSFGIRDFSSSGLENTLSIFLISFILFIISRNTNLNRSFLVVFLLGLINLNRLDTSLITFPFYIFCIKEIYLFSRNKIKNIFISLSIYLSPLIIYYLWSSNFYNYILPNTYFAKTNTSIGRIELILQGLIYVYKSIFHSYLLLFVCLTIFILIALSRNKLIIYSYFNKLILFTYKSKIEKSIQIFILSIISSIIYLIYTVWIGGDFMIGRFLSFPAATILYSFILLIDNIIIENNVKSNRFNYLLILVFIAPLLIFSTPQCQSNKNLACETISAPRAYKISDLGNGIVNERTFYILFRGKYGVGDLYQKASVNRSKIILSDFNYRKYTKSPTIMCGLLGGESLNKIDEYIIDSCGLTDPFLARIIYQPRNDWRIGHFDRRVPLLYIGSIIRAENLFPKESKEYFLLNKVWSKTRKDR